MMRIISKISFLPIVFIIATFMSCDSSVQEKGFEKSITVLSTSVEAGLDSTSKFEVYVSNEAWNTFKLNTDKIIKANKELIEDLRYGSIKTGTRSEMIFEKWIYILEQKNAKLEDRVASYPDNPGEWESFKHEISSDFEKLDEELNNLVKKKEEQKNEPEAG